MQGTLDQVLHEMNKLLVDKLVMQLTMKDVQALGHTCQATRWLVQGLPDYVLMALSRVSDSCPKGAASGWLSEQAGA